MGAIFRKEIKFKCLECLSEVTEAVLTCYDCDSKFVRWIVAVKPKIDTTKLKRTQGKAALDAKRAKKLRIKRKINN